MPKTTQNKAKSATRSMSNESLTASYSMKNTNSIKDKSEHSDEENKSKAIAHKLFSALSLTPQEEHELLQDLFVSALKKSFQNRRGNSFSPFGKQIVLQSNNKDVQAGLAKAEEKIGRALNASVDSDNDKDDDDEDESGLGKFPNLKYAQPKYKNVESILKYNETPDDKGGVKLVIMNFND